MNKKTVTIVVAVMAVVALLFAAHTFNLTDFIVELHGG